MYFLVITVKPVAGIQSYEHVRKPNHSCLRKQLITSQHPGIVPAAPAGDAGLRIEAHSAAARKMAKHRACTGGKDVIIVYRSLILIERTYKQRDYLIFSHL